MKDERIIAEIGYLPRADTYAVAIRMDAAMGSFLFILARPSEGEG